VKTCSDGVTVDLTPPTPGHVWIGIDPTEKYQVCTVELKFPFIDNLVVYFSCSIWYFHWLDKVLITE